MAKKHFRKKIYSDMDLALSTAKEAVQEQGENSEAMITSFEENFSHSPNSMPSTGEPRVSNIWKLQEIDLTVDRFERQAKMAKFIKNMKDKCPPHSDNEIMMIWLDKHKAHISQQNDNRAKLEFFRKTAKCKSFPLKPDFTSFVIDPEEDIDKLNISKEDRLRTKTLIENRKRKQATQSSPLTESQECSEPENLVRRGTSNRPIESTDSDSPIKISSDSSEREYKVEDTTRSVSQNMELNKNMSKISLLPSTKEFPRDIRKRMYPSATDSDSSVKKSPESSDMDCKIYTKETNTPKLNLGHNLNVLHRKPIDRKRLDMLRVDLSSVNLEEPAAKKVKIVPVVWKPEAVKTELTERQRDLREVITRNIKRFRILSDKSNDDTSPEKRIRLDEKATTEGPSRRVIRTAVRKSPVRSPSTSQSPSKEAPPLITPKEEFPNQARRILVPRRHMLRKCKLCGVSLKNLRMHLCDTHLDRTWWGLIGDLTCWLCQRYHKPSDISKCSGAYIPLFHRELFINRHLDFINYLMEDFGVSSAAEVLSKVLELELNTKVVSDFTDREVNFLETLDAHYGLGKKEKYSGRYPTRIVEIMHWRTLIEILDHLKKFGKLTSSCRGNFQASLVDTRCDVLALKKEQVHTGLLSTLPSMAKEIEYFRLVTIIAECHDPTTPIDELMLLMKDPMVRLSLGVSPQNAHRVQLGYYVFCKYQIRNNNLIAIGGLGIDRRATGSTTKKQESIMKEFLAIAEEANKAVRLLSTGDLSKTIDIAKATLSRKHEIHLMNYSGGPEQIQDFLLHFNRGFIGISSKAVDPDPNLLKTIRVIPLERLVVESNSPHQSISFHSKPKPTDVITVMNTIARIKGISVKQVTRVIRANIAKLYHF